MQFAFSGSPSKRKLEEKQDSLSKTSALKNRIRNGWKTRASTL